jgi:hypothetical protein
MAGKIRTWLALWCVTMAVVCGGAIATHGTIDVAVAGTGDR